MSISTPKIIKLHEADNVAVAVDALEAGTHLRDDDLVCRDAVPSGHKIAIAPIDKGEAVIRYGHIIGAASRGIERGEHVHTHNVEMFDYRRDYSVGLELKDPEPVAEKDRAFFQGDRKSVV